MVQDPHGRHAPAPYSDDYAAPRTREAADQRVVPYQQAPQAPLRAQPHQQQPRLRLTGAEAFWYVLGCIAMGGMYFAKVPAKKALEEAGLAEMTAAEKFWYVLQCIFFGAGYFAKLPVKKALTEAAMLYSS